MTCSGSSPSRSPAIRRGRRLYDDAGDTDPTDRLRHAVAELDAARDALHDAQRLANAFWSAIGHIGVEARP